MVNLGNEEMLVVDAVKKYKVVTAHTAYSRISKGWTPEDAVLTPYLRSDNKGTR